MAANSTVAFDPETWAFIQKEANRRRKKPQNFILEIVQDYIEREADFKWWRSIQREYRGRALNEQESVEFVRRIRREKKTSLNGSTEIHRQGAKSTKAKG